MLLRVGNFTKTTSKELSLSSSVTWRASSAWTCIITTSREKSLLPWLNWNLLFFCKCWFAALLFISSQLVFLMIREWQNSVLVLATCLYADWVGVCHCLLCNSAYIDTYADSQAQGVFLGARDQWKNSNSILELDKLLLEPCVLVLYAPPLDFLVVLLVNTALHPIASGVWQTVLYSYNLGDLSPLPHFFLQISWYKVVMYNCWPECHVLCFAGGLTIIG